MLLAGDIGGTKTDLAVYAKESGAHSPVAQRAFRSANYASLQVMVREFLTAVQIDVDEACFDVAGPVIGGRVKTTNLPWVLDEHALAIDLNLRAVHLINDLEAVALAIPVLRADDFFTLNAGNPVPYAPLAVIAPGTGLGESFLTWNGSHYVPHSSEGGHADFAPTEMRQIHLLEYLLKRFDHVGVERVCSGIGIPNIYEYLRDVEHVPETPETARLLASAEDRTRVIVDAAVGANHQSKLCKTTIDMFASILASEAGNLVLKVLATGGIYLTGGVALHTRRVLREPGFMQAFTNKGRFSELMWRIPVHVITARAALVGAATYGLEKYR